MYLGHLSITASKPSDMEKRPPWHSSCGTLRFLLTNDLTGIIFQTMFLLRLSVSVIGKSCDRDAFVPCSVEGASDELPGWYEYETWARAAVLCHGPSHGVMRQRSAARSKMEIKTKRYEAETFLSQQHHLLCRRTSCSAALRVNSHHWPFFVIIHGLIKTLMVLHS